MRAQRVGDRRGTRTAWVDARAGVAGDMLLAALLDAGADLEVVRRDVAAVIGGAVALDVAAVMRGPMRATALRVELVETDQPHRSWREVRRLIEAADLPDGVRQHALLTFEALAQAEARVHGVTVDEVHFHEVGAWDSIADIVGVCAALEDLGVGMLVTSEISVGNGYVRTAHGAMPVPVPAVLELLAVQGDSAHSLPAVHSVQTVHAGESGQSIPAVQPVTAVRSNTDVRSAPAVRCAPAVRSMPAVRPAPTADVGELATPTGVALLVALADGGASGGMPPQEVGVVGVGAGTRDDLPWPNIVRVVVSPEGATSSRTPAWGDGLPERFLEELSANVDDLDPRAWPTVLDALLAAGARDAWLTPIHMKKGRPAFVVSALADHETAADVRRTLFATTSTFGVRSHHVRRVELDRCHVPVEVTVAGHTATIAIKVGSVTHGPSHTEIVRATPEYEEVAAFARSCDRPVAEVLTAATAAAHAAGLRPGEPAPPTRNGTHETSQASV